jgi:glycosyltransferase involved in cell wall biosynthesis
LEQSRALQAELAKGGPFVRVQYPVFFGLGNRLERLPLFNGAALSGNCDIGFPALEDAAEVDQCAERLKRYPLLVPASRWNEDLLRAHGATVALCHQGYDPALFNPAVRLRRARRDGRFAVFSGGKAEYRKGQDLVLEAFSIFAETHDDAVLVAAWSSPFPHFARSFDGKNRIGGPPAKPDGSPDFAEWARRHGIKPRQFAPIPQVPNWLMPRVLAEVDVAVFPNRIEGCTNLVAMECLACGIPTILASGHGHDDLISDGYGIAFELAPPNPFWRGAEVEPIVAALTAVYDAGAAAGPPLGQEWGWPARIAELSGILRGFG